MNQIITIDGPGGAGKSTISRILAKMLGLLYLDTGAMYRAVALQANRMKVDQSDGDALYELCMNLDLVLTSDGDRPGVFIGKEDITSLIRNPEMDMLSSRISAVREVREAMTQLQRKIGRKGGLVAEGRDMGTVVFPEADYKFFLTASPEVRAERRYAERVERKEEVTREDVYAELRKRDEQDSTRSLAPLRPAEDALIIDTSSLGIEQVIDEILSKISKSDTSIV